MRMTGWRGGVSSLRRGGPASLSAYCLFLIRLELRNRPAAIKHFTSHPGLHPMTGGQYANEFPQIAHGIVHLNHAGVAPLPRRTADAIRRYAQIGSEGLASFDPEWYPAVERIRATAARFLGSSADEVAFTKSTTHGLIIIALCVPWKKGDCIVVEQSSFPANWYTWK